MGTIVKTPQDQEVTVHDRFEMLTRDMGALQAALLNMADELKQVKERVRPSTPESIWERMADLTEKLKVSQAKMAALANKENSYNDFRTAMRAKYMKQVFEDKDADGKPLHTNTEKREIAVNILMSQDPDMARGQAELDKATWDKKQAQMEMEQYKLDLKLQEWALQVALK